MARKSSQTLNSINSKGELKKNILMQLEDNKEHLYIQDNQLEKMNEKIKKVIGVNLKISESINTENNENENLSNYNIKIISFLIFN